MAIFGPLKSTAPAQAQASFPAYILSFAFLVFGFLVAGGARDDLVSLLLWRPFSMVLLALSVALYWRTSWANGRALLIFALAIVALPALQLVPLPPAVWTSLPGRELLVAIYRDAGMALPWQPLSVAQARTWNALFSLAAPLALLVAALSLHDHWQRRLVVVLIVIGFISGIIGVVQAIGPAKGPLYFYRITNNGLSVGLFANRNHQAMFLAMIIPLLAANLSFFKGKPDQLLFRRAITIAGGLMLLPLISVMGRLDPNLRDASAALGASRWRTLFRVTLPLSLPGLTAGCALVFASATTAFISQSIIGGNRLVYLPLLIWQQSLVVYNWPLASVAALTLLISVTAGIVAISALGRRGTRYLNVG